MLGLHWATPGHAWALLLPLVVGIFAWRGRRAGERALRRSIHPDQWEARMAGNRGGTGWLRWAWGLAGMTFLAIALLGPTRGSTLMPVQRKGIDIVACLDTSRSMLAQDVGETRLSEAKKELRSLMEVLRGDRMALIAFAGDVRQVAPLTRDMQTLSWFMDTLGPRDNRLGGTDLGGAIDAAVELFEERSGAHEAILLVTDGEDLEEQGLAAAERAAEAGIRIYVLGMGTEGGAKVPAAGGGWVQDETGVDVISQLVPATLEAIAETTGGMFLPAHGTVLPLEQLYTRGFSQLEGRQYDQGFEEVPSDRYQWPLLFALFCLGMEMALGGRRRLTRREPSSVAEGGASTNAKSEELAA